MTITFDATNGGTVAATTTLNFNHTIGSGSNRLLVVGFSTEVTDNNPPTVSSVTYNSVAMSFVRSDSTGESGITANTFLYYMDEANLPATGTFQVSIVMNISQTDINGGSISVAGAGQSGSEADNGTFNTTSGSTVSVSITTLTNDAWVFSVVGSGNAIAFTPTSPQVERWDNTGGTSGGAGDTKPVASSGATTIEWTFDVSSNRDALSAAAWPEAGPTTFKIDGITKDLSGNILISCQVYLVKDNGDNTYTWLQHQVSNGTTGAYSFTGITDNDPNYQVITWKDNTPHVFDVTDHVITPVAE